ncbi:Chymotrypsinogen B2 [Armadillidium nasatum]|uniref:Chymotrypsinogen B2 n=1 Tax=Armadillidium nasatum TaxID=96803 RepID=A0A5N5SL18_9CRUS|nr:Chymotrypsinogen B2 [Armadillidium nasatum]
MKRYIFLLCLIFGFVKTEYERNSAIEIMVAIFGKEFFNKNNMTIKENKSLQYDQEEKLPYYNNEEFEHCDCGPVYNNQERIHKGKDVNPLYKYPWAVYINYTKNGDKAFCTGSIIHENYVLTAAHCFLLGNTPEEGIIDIDTVKIFVGNFSLSPLDDIENVTQIVQINKIIFHEEVNLKFWENDIALLRLSKPLDLKSHKEIKSICLPSPSVTDVEKMTTIGWGATGPKEKKYPKMLHEAQFLVINRCRNPYTHSLDYQHLCILGDPKASSLCKGDSGGPTMRIKNGRYEVVGITSFTPEFDGICFSSSKPSYLE